MHAAPASGITLSGSLFENHRCHDSRFNPSNKLPHHHLPQMQERLPEAAAVND
jgi:hypothetical protein